MSGGPASNRAAVPGVLKAFVITSGVILLIGVILLAVMIMLKASRDVEDSEAVDLPSAPIDLALPEGARVDQVIANGKRLVLLAEDADGGQYLAVVDALSGERLSLMRIIPSR